jgi:hypothetical protein
VTARLIVKDIISNALYAMTIRVEDIFYFPPIRM